MRKIKELIEDNGDRILLIVDNLDTTEDKNIKLLFELGCRILITSRVDLASVFKRPQMDITVFSDLSFARELFEQYYLFADEESNDVDAIINLVQGHTLAIELIAKQIDAEWSNIKEIRSKLESGGLSSIGCENIDNAKDDIYTQDNAFGHIKALFDLSIFEKGNKENELYILANLSLMPFTGINRQLLADWCDFDNHGGKTCINNLIKSGWVNHDGDLVALHPLIAEVTARISNKEIWDNLPLLKKSINYVSSNALSSQKKYELAILLKNISINLINAKIKTRFSIRFIFDAIGIFSNYGDIQKAIDCCLTGIEFLKEIAPTAKNSIAKFNNRLGLLYQNKGVFDAAEFYFKESLNIYLQTKKIDDIATSYNNLGTVFCAKGRLNDATEYYQKALNILEANPSSVSTNIATTYNNLAKIYCSLNNLEQAELLFKKAILFCKEENAKKATMYANLGDLYYDQHKINVAEEYYLRALDIRIKLFTDCSPAVATSYNSLAKVYNQLGQISKAEHYYHKALELRLKFDEVHIDTAVSYGNLGVFYQEQKRHSLAKDNYLKAIFICEALHMNQSRGFAVYCYNLGTIYHEQNDYNTAENYYQKALDIYITFYKEERKYINVFCKTLELLYLQQGKISKAAKYRKKASR